MAEKSVSYDLDALLTAQEQGVELLHATPLDRAIVAGKYEEALKLWEEMEVGAPAEDAAKAGFASWMQTGSCKDLLTRSNVGSHPTAGAAVALSLYAQAMAMEEFSTARSQTPRLNSQVDCAPGDRRLGSAGARREPKFGGCPGLVAL